MFSVPRRSHPAAERSRAPPDSVFPTASGACGRPSRSVQESPRAPASRPPADPDVSVRQLRAHRGERRRVHPRAHDSTSGGRPKRLLETWGLVPRALVADPVVGRRDGVHEHVHARLDQPAAHRREHALPLDLRRQRRGRDGPRPLPRLLPRSAACARRRRRRSSTPTSVVPMVGASGAISAVLAAYVFLYPRSPITVLNPIFLLWFFFGLFLEFPAWLVIGAVLRREPVERARHEHRRAGSRSWRTWAASWAARCCSRLFMAGAHAAGRLRPVAALAERREQQSSLW